MNNKSCISNKPELELILPAVGQSFRWHQHDYPSELACWHHHPEYELHLITKTYGTMFVGDHISNFEPGNLVLLGPNLPHNWISNDLNKQQITKRDVVLQFNPSALGIDPHANSAELSEIKPLLTRADRGLLFTGGNLSKVYALFANIGKLQGLSGLLCVYQLLLELSSKESKILASEHYRPSLDDQTIAWMQQVASLLMDNLSNEIKMSEIAKHFHMTDTNFSRFFKRCAGLNFSAYLRKIRIGKACRLLVDSDWKITVIANECGFRNLSNFNRYFLLETQLTPINYRTQAKKRTENSYSQLK